MRNTILFIVAVLSFQFAVGNDDFSKEVVKSTPLTSSLFMLEGAGGNITVLVGPDGVLLVGFALALVVEKGIGFY